MSRRTAAMAPGHQRARELAAARANEPLSPKDAAWLADHLEVCADCAVIAAEYDAQHRLFGALRQAIPQPPRDMWARTAAAIEAERSRTRQAGRWRRLRRAPGRSTRLALTPVLAIAVVAVVVGAGLLNGGLTTPLSTAAAATPIAIKGAADLQVLSLDGAGNLQLLSRRVDEVCPTGVKECGVSPTFDVTSVSAFGTAADVLGAMSPSGGQMVVVRRDPGSQGVYIVPVRQAAIRATASPTAQLATATVPATSSHPAGSPKGTEAPSSASASPSPSPSHGSAHPASPAAATTSPSASSTGSQAPTESPVPSDRDASASPSESVTPAPSASSPSASPSVLIVPATSPAAATAVASVEVSPAPEVAIKIASDVTVVGAPTYSPDGNSLAFSAMPVDGSVGPDIYVWTVGDQVARAITTDHDSWLAGWTATGILVSRVDSGLPTTFRLDPATGEATAIGSPGTWLPSVSPTGTVAGWWSGTLKKAADGVTWVPDQGQLVLGAWPSTSLPDGASEVPSQIPFLVASQIPSQVASQIPSQVASQIPSQVLATIPLDAWQVRWDDTGAVVAVWVGEGDGRNGRLSLYQLDETTGVPDLANPTLNAVPANPDFSLRAGRLAWTTPDLGDGVPRTVHVLAWSGETVYPLMELPADGSGTVVP